jgi:hypothetical protein
MKTARFVVLVAVLASLVAILFAQVDPDNSWATHRGNNPRTGVTGNARRSAVKMLLGWTYPSCLSLGRHASPNCAHLRLWITTIPTATALRE